MDTRREGFVAAAVFGKPLGIRQHGDFAAQKSLCERALIREAWVPRDSRARAAAAAGESYL